VEVEAETAKYGDGVVVTDLLDQQDKLVRRLLLIVEFKFCRGRGCSIDQLTEQ
jgi:hypothetical protein